MLSSIKSLFTGDPASKTPAARLRKICEKGTVDEVSHQLDHGGVDLQGDGSKPGSLIEAAMEGDNIPVLKYLITRFQDGQSTLPWEAAHGASMQAVKNVEHFKLLWEANPGVMTTHYGHAGNAPGWAVLGNHLKVVAFMLEKGLGPDEPTVWNRPAINCAAADGNAEMIILLLDHGANIKKTNVLAEAQEEGRIDILKLLVEKGGMDINTPQKDPDFYDDSDVEEDGDVNDGNDDNEAKVDDDKADDDKVDDDKAGDGKAGDGRADDGNDDDDDYMATYEASEAAKKSPVLHLAIAHKQPEVIRALLLDLNADAMATDRKGRTAWQLAEEKGDKKILKILAQAQKS